MKKLFIVFAAATLFIGVQACKSNSTGEVVETDEVLIEETPTEETVTNTESTSTVSPEVQAYIDAYNAYFEEYKEAVNSKNMTKMSGLATKGQELLKKSQELATTLTEEDSKKLREFSEAKAKEIQALVSQMTGQ